MNPSIRVRDRYLALYGFLIGAALVVASQSRTVLGGAVCGALLLLLQYRRYKGRILTTFIVALIPMVLALSLRPDIVDWFRNALSDRLERTVSSIEDPTGGRIELWQQALDSFKASPIVGVGIGNATQVIFSREIDTDYRPGVHHFFLAVLSENGLIGFGLALAFVILATRIVTPVKMSDFRDPERRFLWGFVKTTYLCSLFMSVLGVPDYLFWVAVLALILVRDEQREKRRFGPFSPLGGEPMLLEPRALPEAQVSL